jgi:hypothetical protein
VRADGSATYSADRIRAALASAGWRVTSFEQRRGATATLLDWKVGETGIPTVFVSYEATKGDLQLVGNGNVFTGSPLAGEASYDTRVWPLEAAAVRPLTIAGILAGIIAGWWLTAAFAYRSQRNPRPVRWAAALLSTVGFAAAAVPVHVHYRDAYQVMVYAHGSPYPYLVDGPIDGFLALICTGIALAAVGAALLTTRSASAPAAWQHSGGTHTASVSR